MHPELTVVSRVSLTCQRSQASQAGRAGDAGPYQSDGGVVPLLFRPWRHSKKIFSLSDLLLFLLYFAYIDPCLAKGCRRNTMSNMHSGPVARTRMSRRLVSLGSLVAVTLLAMTWLRPYLAEKYDVVRLDPVLEACSAHPISCRVQRAQELFDQFQARQSKTVAQAVQQYIKRYGRRPPPGFEGWVQYALDNNASVIDDYDQIEADMAPFREMSTELIYHRMAEATLIYDEISLGVLNIRNGTVTTTGPDGAFMSISTLKRILKPVEHVLPDVTILFNWFAEPRVLDTSPSQSSPSSNKAAQMIHKLASGKSLSAPRMNVYDESGKDTTVWMDKACPANHLSAADEWQHLNPPLDYCREDPNDLRPLHGFFQGPDQFRPFDQQVPILSRGKLSPFGDILIPNVCYFHEMYRGAREVGGPVIPDPRPFELKRDALYWRGSSTGLSQRLDNWAGGHRHRAIRYFKQLREAAEKLQGRPERDPVEVALGRKDYVPTRDSANVGNNTLPLFDYTDPDLTQAIQRLGPNMFDVSFSNYVNANEQLSAEMNKYIPPTGQLPGDTIYNYKYLLDMDGQSMSCRFYQLLASNSLIIKQTVWGEWHDDRLVPWLHYVPIDIAIENNQLPMLLDYFMHTPEGLAEATKIAKAGSEWASSALRQVDITLYYYRVLLEFAHLLNP